MLPPCPQCEKCLSKKAITKNISDKVLHEKCNEICCYCGKSTVLSQANCSYHSACENCKNIPGIECKICKLFDFKYLGIKCCNCESIVDLKITTTLSCMHNICKNCLNHASPVTCHDCNISVSIKPVFMY